MGSSPIGGTVAGASGVLAEPMSTNCRDRLRWVRDFGTIGSVSLEPSAVSPPESAGGLPIEQSSPLERSELRRELILDAAVALVTEHGLSGVSLDTVAAAAGVEPATVEYYFGDRINVLAEALRELRYQRLERKGMLMATLPPAGSSVADWNRAGPDVARGMVGLCGPGRHTLWELLAQASRLPGLAVEARDDMAEIQESLGQLMLNCGVPRGELLAAPLLVLEYGLITQQRVLGGSEQEVVDDLAHALLSLINGHLAVVQGTIPLTHS